MLEVNSVIIPVISRDMVTPECSTVYASCIHKEEVVNELVKDLKFILLVAPVATPKSLLVASDVLPSNSTLHQL